MYFRLMFIVTLLFLPAVVQGQTVQDADKFVAAAEQQLDALERKTSLAEWVQATHITDDTEALAAIFAEQLSALKKSWR